jgi:hypothetical protein
MADVVWSAVNDGYGIVGYYAECPYCDATIDPFSSADDLREMGNDEHVKCVKCQNLCRIIDSPDD